MKIAQVAPLYESVPPQTYGGTERVVAWLTEELVAMGHDVTLFASGDSRTPARLVPCCPRALRLANTPDTPEVAAHLLEMERVSEAVTHERFDVVHFHTETMHLPLARRMQPPSVTTLHGRLDAPEAVAMFREFRELPLVSISEAQREPLPFANRIATVHHGMPTDLLAFHPEGDAQLAFLGRVSRDKRPDRAIEIARRAGLKLIIAAKIGKDDEPYWSDEVVPLVEAAGDDVDFIGEVDDVGKQELLGSSLGMLFPIDWPEPFGLAMIESLACGTPVVAWRRGSVPSVIEDGVTGFIVDTIDDAIAAVARLPDLDRARVRAEFERRFSVRHMAEQYLEIYRRVAADARARDLADGAGRGVSA